MCKIFKIGIVMLALMMPPCVVNASTISKLLADNFNIPNKGIKTVYINSKDESAGILLLHISYLIKCRNDEISYTKLVNCIEKLKIIDETFDICSCECILKQISSVIIHDNKRREEYLLKKYEELLEKYEKILARDNELLDLWVAKLSSLGCERVFEKFPKNFISKNYHFFQIFSSTDDKFDDIQIDLMEKFIERSNDVTYYLELLSHYSWLLSKGDSDSQYLNNTIERISDKKIFSHCSSSLNEDDSDNEYLKHIPYLNNAIKRISDKIIERYEVLEEDFNYTGWNGSVTLKSIKDWGEKFFELDSSLNKGLSDFEFFDLTLKKKLEYTYKNIRKRFLDKYEYLYSFDDINKTTFLLMVKSYEKTTEFIDESLLLPTINFSEKAITDYCKQLFPSEFKYSVIKCIDYLNLLLGNIKSNSYKDYQDVLSILRYDENHFMEISPENPYLAYLNTVMIALNQVGNDLCKDVMLLIMNDLDHVNEYHKQKNLRPNLIPSDFRLTAADFSNWINLFIKTGHIDLANMAAEGFIKTAKEEPVLQSELINPDIIKLLPLKDIANYTIIKESIDLNIEKSMEENIGESINKIIKEFIEVNIEESINKIIKESINKIIKESMDENIERSINKIIKESIKANIEESINKIIKESIEGSIERSINKIIKESIDANIERSINKIIKEFIDESIEKSIDENIKESINANIEKSINKIIKESIDANIERSINENIKESIDEITEDLLMVYPNDGNYINYIYEQTTKLADHFAEMSRLILIGNN